MPCGDPRDQIIAEYPAYHVDFTPSCPEFTQGAHSEHFTFAELNSGDYTWAIVRLTLLTGIESTRINNGSAPLKLNGGYRNPAHNATVPHSAPSSRHVHGDAVDFASDQSAFDALRAAGKKANACAEPSGMSGYGHVHLDWRGTCPPTW